MLEQHFAELVDYGFTRDLEGGARSGSPPVRSIGSPTLEDFYFGPKGADGDRAGHPRDRPTDRLPEIDAVAAINTFELGADDNGMMIIAKPGRGDGPYVQRGDAASVPETLAPAGSHRREGPRGSARGCPGGQAHRHRYRNRPHGVRHERQASDPYAAARRDLDDGT